MSSDSCRDSWPNGSCAAASFEYGARVASTYCNANWETSSQARWGETFTLEQCKGFCTSSSTCKAIAFGSAEGNWPGYCVLCDDIKARKNHADWDLYVRDLCERPEGWCIGDSTYELKDCDGDGIPDHTCSHGDWFGVIMSSDSCRDSWPNGSCDIAGSAGSDAGDRSGGGGDDILIGDPEDPATTFDCSNPGYTVNDKSAAFKKVKKSDKTKVATEKKKLLIGWPEMSEAICECTTFCYNGGYGFWSIAAKKTKSDCVCTGEEATLK